MFIHSELQLSSPRTHLKDIVPTSDMVADWLEMASAVKEVSIDLNHYDDTSYCGTAYNFQKQRSEVLSSISTALSTFQYIWCSFELLCKCLPIDLLPKGFKNGRASFVDSAQYYIKQRFDPKLDNTIIFYRETIDYLRSETSKLSYHDLTHLFQENDYTRQLGIGIQVVKSIRNIFAHGATHVPHSEEKPDTISCDLEHFF